MRRPVRLTRKGTHERGFVADSLRNRGIVRTWACGGGGYGRSRCKIALPATDVDPLPELESDAALDSRQAEAELLVERDARVNREPDGFVKVVADAKTDRVLGVWMIASVAGKMIAQAAQAMEFGATSEDIAYTCHAHP